MRFHSSPSHRWRRPAAAAPARNPFRELAQIYRALPEAARDRASNDAHRRSDVPTLSNSLTWCRYCRRWVTHHVLHMVSEHRHDIPIPAGRPLTGCSACGRFTVDLEAHRRNSCTARPLPEAG